MTAFRGMIPEGLRVDVRSDVADLPDEPGAIGAVICDTNDPAWPCMLNFYSCADECNLGPYPDLRIAAGLWERFGVDSLCGTYPFAGDLDPHDPYWSLACIGGRWHLASTCGSPLMGPYTDGTSKSPGDEPVRLVREVAVPELPSI